MSVRIATFLLILAMGGSLRADPEAARQQFDQLFGEDVRKALATPTTSDDLQLAGALLGAAGGSADKPDLLAILCDQVAVLAMKDPAGYATAADAMVLLVEKVEGRRLEGLQKLADIRQKQYTSAKAAERAAPGEQFVQATLNLVEAQRESAQPDQAVVALNKALGVATAVKSPLRDQVKALLERMGAELQAEKKIAAVKEKLKVNKADAAAAEELVRLYIVEKDDPVEARKYTFLVADEPLKENVRLATVALDELTDQQSYGLAEWYQGLAGEAKADIVKSAMLQRVVGYWDRYVSAHTEQDLFLAKAKVMQKKAADEVAALEKKLGPSGSAAKSAGKPWVDLMAMADSAQQGGQGWRRNGAAMETDGQGSLSFPVSPQGGYEMQMGWTTRSLLPGSSLILRFPVGPNSVNLLLRDTRSPNPSSLAMVNGAPPGREDNPTRFPGALLVGQDQTLELKVRLAGAEAAIDVSVNGKTATSWKGPPSQLTPFYGIGAPRAVTVIAYNSGTAIALTALRIRMLDGELAKLDFSAPPGAPMPPGVGQVGAPTVPPGQQGGPQSPELMQRLADIRNRWPNLTNAERLQVIFALRSTNNPAAQQLARELELSP